MKTTIILARHGETLWNREKRVQGQTNIPLSEEGIEQAKALGKKIKELKITRSYASRLQRAVKTAELALSEIESEATVHQHEGLNERAFGEHEGKPWEEIDKIVNNRPEEFFQNTPKNGEAYLFFKKRVLNAFEEIIIENEGEVIFIVTHGGTMRVLLRHLKKIPDHGEITEHLGNTALFIFHIEGNNIIPELLDNTKTSLQGGS